MPTLFVVHPVFPMQITASPTLQGSLKMFFGEAVVARDMPNHTSLHLLTVARRGSCNGPTWKLILLRTQSLVLCSKQEMRRSVQQGPCLSAIGEDGVTEDFYSLHLLTKLMVLLPKLLFNPVIAAIPEAILMRISAE